MKHTMHLDPVPFLQIKSGQKTIELRLYDEKRRAIHPGDTIVFHNASDPKQILTSTVKALHIFDSFDTLYQKLPLLQCGYTSADIENARPADMAHYYSAEDQAKWGVVGIELFPLPQEAPAHQVYLEKMSAFSRMLRLEGIAVSPQETADACQAIIALGLEDKQNVKLALSAIYAKSREEQLIFNRVFDGFFIGEEAMRAQAQEQALQQAQMEAIRAESQDQLQINGQPMMLSEDQRTTFASMPQEERQRLLDFLEKYKPSAERNQELYGGFIHSVFTKSLLEQQIRMEEAASSAASTDPDIGLLYRDISDFKDHEIPKAIALIQTIAQQINAELTARQKSSGSSSVLDFRKTIRKGLETGGTFYRLKYKKKPRRKKHMVLLCDVSGSMIQFSEFALRFIQSLNQASESSRTFVFSETVAEADAFSLQNMDLFREQVRRSGIYGKGTNLAEALEYLCRQQPPVLNDATTLIILSDTKTTEQVRAWQALKTARQLCSKVIWLNPIPESRWEYLRSARMMAQVSTMISCNTLSALAGACRKLALRDS